MAVINDEAQHIGKVGSGKRHQDQLDVIKSLADLTQTVHVLVGTYELLPLSQLSAQLIGRSINIHFPRYLPTKKDQHKFKRLLKSFQEVMPFEEEPDTLLDNWQFCYERSIGCIGNLRLMLIRAVKAALRSDQKTLTKDVLEKHAFSVAECHYMMSQAREGEGQLAEIPQQLLELRTWSGFIRQQSSIQTSNGSTGTGGTSSTAASASMNKTTTATSTSASENASHEQTATATAEVPNSQISASSTPQTRSELPTTKRPHRGGTRKTPETTS